MFKAGDIVEHIFEKEWVMVVEDKGDNQILCRTKDLRLETFYRFELKLR